MNGDRTGSRRAGSRERVLRAVRSALANVSTEQAARQISPRQAAGGQRGRSELFAERVADYRAAVHQCTPEMLPRRVAELVRHRDASRVAVPDDLPAHWLAELDGRVQTVRDGELTIADLDTVDSVITGCALAIAETGTLVLDGGPGQGRRMLTLLPDHHICVVGAGQVLATVGDAIAAVAPTRPLTWISGPSATSDIELHRVEGVHGPRTLEVLLVQQ